MGVEVEEGGGWLMNEWMESEVGKKGASEKKQEGWVDGQRV